VDYLRIRNNYITFDSGSVTHLVYKCLVAYAIKQYHGDKRGRKVLETEKIIDEGIIDVFDCKREIAFEVQTIHTEKVEEDKSKYPYEVRIINIDDGFKKTVQKIYESVREEVERLP
jgi:hypothetical protein